VIIENANLRADVHRLRVENKELLKRVRHSDNNAHMMKVREVWWQMGGASAGWLAGWMGEGLTAGKFLSIVWLFGTRGRSMIALGNNQEQQRFIVLLKLFSLQTKCR